MIIYYRFEHDPEDMIREYNGEPYWDEKHKALCLIPANAFEGKSIVLLGNPILNNKELLMLDFFYKEKGL